MKHLFLLATALFANLAFAQTEALKRISTSQDYPKFLRLLVRTNQLDYECDSLSDTPVYSWLGLEKPLNAQRRIPRLQPFTREYNQERYAIAVDGYHPSVTVEQSQFVAVSYTKGDFIVLLSRLQSFRDIVEFRIYTYRYDGEVIDSLTFFHEHRTKEGFGIVPKVGALLKNLNVLTCEIQWEGHYSPYEEQTRRLKNGQWKGQRIDSYYELDTSGHFILKRQTKYRPQIYQEKEIIMMHAGYSGILTNIYQGNEPVLEVVEY